VPGWCCGSIACSVCLPLLPSLLLAFAFSTYLHCLPYLKYSAWLYPFSTQPSLSSPVLAFSFSCCYICCNSLCLLQQHLCLVRKEKKKKVTSAVCCHGPSHSWCLLEEGGGVHGGGLPLPVPALLLFYSYVACCWHIRLSAFSRRVCRQHGSSYGLTALPLCVSAAPCAIINNLTCCCHISIYLFCWQWLPFFRRLISQNRAFSLSREKS